MKTLSIAAGGLIAAILAGCASSPPPELRNARSAYQQVAQSPAASVAPTDVYEAKRALERAEGSFQNDGDSPETRDLAYIAERRAIIAQSRANTVVASAQKQAALADLQKWKQDRALATRQELGETEKQLAKSQAQLESERQARIAAEKRTEETLAAMKGMTSKQEARGLVVTITGGVLFATGKSELMPTAQRRLDGVVEAVKSDPRPITIIGHTDSVGDESMNQRLSLDRAESVRNYMVSHGVPADRITAQGMGENQPIASNKSAEGRANNRRVEIILQGSAGGAAPMPGMGEPSGGKSKGKQESTQPATKQKQDTTKQKQDTTKQKQDTTKQKQQQPGGTQQQPGGTQQQPGGM